MGSTIRPPALADTREFYLRGSREVELAALSGARAIAGFGFKAVGSLGSEVLDEFLEGFAGLRLGTPIGAVGCLLSHPPIAEAPFADAVAVRDQGAPEPCGYGRDVLGIERLDLGRPDILFEVRLERVVLIQDDRGAGGAGIGDFSRIHRRARPAGELVAFIARGRDGHRIATVVYEVSRARRSHRAADAGGNRERLLLVGIKGGKERVVAVHGHRDFRFIEIG